jgi:hypothetical protein
MRAAERYRQGVVKAQVILSYFLATDTTPHTVAGLDCFEVNRADSSIALHSVAATGILCLFLQMRFLISSIVSTAFF